MFLQVELLEVYALLSSNMDIGIIGYLITTLSWE